MLNEVHLDRTNKFNVPQQNYDVNVGDIVLSYWPCPVSKKYPNGIKSRPVYVVAKQGGTVTCLEITSHKVRSEFKGEVELNNWNSYGLDKPSVIRCSQVIVIGIKDLGNVIGQLNSDDAEYVQEEYSNLEKDDKQKFVYNKGKIKKVSEDINMEQEKITEARAREQDIIQGNKGDLEATIKGLRQMGYCIPDENEYIAFVFRDGNVRATTDRLQKVDDADVLDRVTNDCIIALADYLDIDPSLVNYRGYDYYETENDGDYYVGTYDEMYDKAVESAEELINDAGFDNIGIDPTYYMDEDFFQEMMEESNYDYAREIEDESDDEYENRLVAECVDYDIISFPDDFELNEDVDQEDEYFDADDPTNYHYAGELDLVNELADYLSNGEDGCQWYLDNFGEGDLKYLIENNPDAIDTHQAAVDLIDNYGIANELASYDGDEIELPMEDIHGNTLYAYRCN